MFRRNDGVCCTLPDLLLASVWPKLPVVLFVINVFSRNDGAGSFDPVTLPISAWPAQPESAVNEAPGRGAVKLLRKSLDSLFISIWQEAVLFAIIFLNSSCFAICSLRFSSCHLSFLFLLFFLFCSSQHSLFSFKIFLRSCHLNPTYIPMIYYFTHSIYLFLYQHETLSILSIL